MTERKIEKEVVIKADVETVWKALTDAEELRRWFGLDARVQPGAGGSVWITWSGPEAGWEAPIEVWDAPHHLRTLESAGSKVTVDYFIEARGGETVLRLVHSGFSGDMWDDEMLDTLDSGWGAFLATLQHYLERHPGEPRVLVHARLEPVELTRAEAFLRTMHVLGFPAEQQLQPGDRYAVTTEAGDRLEGTVAVFRPAINFSGTVDAFSGAFLMVEMEPGEKPRPAVWLSLYGNAASEAAAVQERLRRILGSAFA